MNRGTLAAPLLLALAAGALVAPTSSGAAARCSSGMTKVDGKPARAFCGSAKAVATVGSKTFRFTGGECAMSGSFFTLNIGTVVLDPAPNPKPGKLPYFGMTVNPGDSGVHLSQALSWTSAGTRYSVLANRVTLKKGLKSGSFSGRALPGGKMVTGTFSC